MPTVPLHPRAENGCVSANAMPPLLHTPSGLAILELQGSVVTDQSEGALDLGKLVFPPAEGQDTWDGKRVFLLVGRHQRMTGEVKRLAKPLAIVRRRQSNPLPTAELESSPHADDAVEIAQIVHFKILFAHRPEPVGGQQDATLDE